METIKYYKKCVYGIDKYYLVNDEASTTLLVESILRLLGQKTISLEQIELFKNLGIKFEQIIN